MESQVDDPLTFVRRVRAGVMTSAILAALFVLFGPLPETRQTVIMVHHVGLSVLALFLLLGEACHLWVLLLVRAKDTNWHSMGKVTNVWRVLTDLMPGPAALIICASGLRLLYEGSYSLRLTWLLVLVAGFGLFFADGLLGYTPAINRLQVLGARTDDAGTRAELQAIVRSWSFNLMLLLHFASFPLLYVVGRHKLLPAYRPLYSALTTVDSLLHPVVGRMTGVVTAVSLIAIEALIVLLIRRK